MGKTKTKERNTTKNKEPENLLKKLTRADLLELLIEQTKRADELEAKLQQVTAELEKQKLTINNAGSMTQAALELNKVFEAADKAAQQYVENVRTMAGKCGDKITMTPPPKKTAPAANPAAAALDINIDDWFKPVQKKTPEKKAAPKTPAKPAAKTSSGTMTGMQLGEFLQKAVDLQETSAVPKKQPAKKPAKAHPDPKGQIDVAKILGNK